MGNTSAVPAPHNKPNKQHFTFTETGLAIDGQPSYDEWETMGRKLRRLNKGIQWAIGDWLVYGENHYGETYTQALEWTDYTYYGLAHLRYVASRFPIERRRSDVPFSHHYEVASLDPEIADKFLSIASERCWSSRDLRTAVQNWKDENAPGTEVGPAIGCGDPAGDHPIDGIFSRLSNAKDPQLSRLSYPVREAAEAYHNGNLVLSVNNLVSVIDHLLTELEGRGVEVEL